MYSGISDVIKNLNLDYQRSVEIKMILQNLVENPFPHLKTERSSFPNDDKFNRQITNLYLRLLNEETVKAFSLQRKAILYFKLLFEISFINNIAKDGSDVTSFPLDFEKMAEEISDSKTFENFKALFGTYIDRVPLLFSPLHKDDNEKFSIVCREAVKLSVYFHSIYLNDCYSLNLNDEEVEQFENSWNRNLELIEGKNRYETEKWWSLAASFFGMYKNIGTSYSMLDSIVLRNSKIEADWLKEFSTYEIDVENLLYKKKLLEMQITIKTLHSEISQQDCLTKSKLEMLDEEEKIRKLTTNSAWAGFMSNALQPDFIKSNDKYISEYRQRADYFCRQAVKILHPDRRAFILDGKKLSEEQEEELNKLYNEIIELREKETVNSLDIINGDFFSVSKFKRILSQAEAVYGMIGIKLPKLKFLILGKTFEEQLEFLMNEENLLLIELAKVEAEIQVTFSDNEYYQKEMILKSPGAIEATKLKYKKIIDTYSGEIEILEKELESLFKE